MSKCIKMKKNREKCIFLEEKPPGNTNEIYKFWRKCKKMYSKMQDTECSYSKNRGVFGMVKTGNIE